MSVVWREKWMHQSLQLKLCLEAEQGIITARRAHTDLTDSGAVSAGFWKDRVNGHITLNLAWASAMRHPVR